VLRIGRNYLAALAGVLASGACSLLAPSDESLFGGPSPRDGAPTPRNDAPSGTGGAPDAPVEAPDGTPDASGDGRGSDADVVDAPTDETDSADTARPCTSANECGRGNFCSTLGRCESCRSLTSLTDLSQLEFGVPEPLSKINGSAPEESLRFPRAFDSMNGLVYQRSLFGTVIWRTQDFLDSPGALLSGPLDTPGLNEGAPLKVESAGGVLSPYNLFLNMEVRRASGTANELFAAKVDSNGYTASVTRLGEPFNRPASEDHTNVTLALSQNRAVWADYAPGGLAMQLMTAPLDNPQAIKLDLVDATGCPIYEFDYAPWLTPDGRLLFFNSMERTPQCTGASGNGYDIFVIELDGLGLPVGDPVPLAGISKPGSIEVDGSLSADLCWLYFAASQPEEKTRLFRAPRVH